MGSLCAIFLAKRGFHVDLYEARQGNHIQKHHAGTAWKWRGGGGEGSKARGVGWVCVYQIPYNPRVVPHITYETLSSISEATIFYHSNPLVEVN